MRNLVFLTFLFVSSLAFANDSLKIPRSTVIELTEPSTNRVYPLFIKLPRSYESNKDKKYPVIYLMDAWYSFQIASGATRFPMNSGAMEEAIIVGVSYSNGSKGPSSRVRDYTPVKAASWKLETGNADEHATFIRETVFPYIETTYRAKPSERTFVGNSLGGLFGAYILFEHPDMFDSYILGSPSVWFDNNHILNSKVTKSELPIKVYLSVGSLEQPEFGEKEDMVAGAKLLANKITTQTGEQTLLEFRVVEGAKHATAFPTTLIQGLDWIYSKQ
ncbi:alpha/beta hydrolase [Alteromonas gilva]|uniref:Alpha/beta hydrolase-fold protein n=1 Tax=Alteromonas gilva TaxID=2987522 RepID=A0ABT5KYT8_9ALTE|nr:alpha/beta hydrolase-fold protein [Alteromonas gilva]MDC8829371.1 alpha/beta hydrolase-fold protein [Alteromonas gilva]